MGVVDLIFHAGEVARQPRPADPDTHHTWVGVAKRLLGVFTDKRPSISELEVSELSIPKLCILGQFPIIYLTVHGDKLTASQMFTTSKSFAGFGD